MTLKKPVRKRDQEYLAWIRLQPMENKLRTSKRVIRGFMTEHYTDSKLVELLDHARADKLVYTSCCCFIGIPTADHELRSDGCEGTHYHFARSLKGAIRAEIAYLELCVGYVHLLPVWTAYNDCETAANALRRKRLIPMILAEMKRRKLRVKPLLESVSEEWTGMEVGK